MDYAVARPTDCGEPLINHSPSHPLLRCTAMLVIGLASGISMGFGSYCVMPIPLSLALIWFIGTWIESTVAGAIVGAIVK